MSKLMRAAAKNTGVVQIPDSPPPILIGEDSAADPLLHAAELQQQTMVQQLYDERLQAAQEEGERLAQKMLLHAKKERGEILSQAQLEAEAIRENARREGYRAGIDEKAAQIAETLEKTAQDIAELKTAHANLIAEMQASVQDFALEIAGHLLSKTIDRDETALKDLVSAAIEEVKDTTWITLELSQEVPNLVAELEREYAKTRPGRARIEVRARELPKDAVLLNTPDGVVDATLSKQLENLREGFLRQRLQMESEQK